MKKRVNTVKRVLLYILFPIIFLYTKFIQKLFPIKILSEEETRKKILEGGEYKQAWRWRNQYCIGEGHTSISRL